MLVTYVYQADDGIPPSPTKSPQKGKHAPPPSDVKSFSFWALVPLGTVVQRPQGDARRAAAASTAST